MVLALQYFEMYVSAGGYPVIVYYGPQSVNLYPFLKVYESKITVMEHFAVAIHFRCSAY